jgi:hypothetical protein
MKQGEGRGFGDATTVHLALPLDDVNVIGNAAIADNLSASSFSFRDLKKKPSTIFLVLPAWYLSTCGKWFRHYATRASVDMNSMANGETGISVRQRA